MSFKPVQTDQAPAAVGPYSQAVRAGNQISCSGQIPLNPETGTLVEGEIEDQVHQVMANLKAVLEAAGAGLKDVVRSTIYLTDLGHFQRVNTVYAGYFKAPFPARVTIQAAALPLGAAVEVDVIAVQES